MSDCRNDCRDPVAFPRQVVNRPGLDRIGYRIGTYADIREALLHWLDSDPALRRFTHRASDDPAIALLEGAAIIGDILTFYQELYANEKYLRTATWRDSVSDLVRLLGYRLAPGAGGRGSFAFEVRGDQPVTIPRRFRLTADVTGRDGKSDFETQGEALAWPALSRFALYRPAYFPNIATGTTRFSVDTAALAAAGVTIEKGNRLMIVAQPLGVLAHRQIVVVEAVREQFERTEITIRGAWQGAATQDAMLYKLGRTFRYFGYNGPEQKTVVSGTTVSQVAVSFAHETGTPLGWFLVYVLGAHYPLPTLASFPLSQQVDDLAAGSVMIATLALGQSAAYPASTPDYFFERRIRKVHQESLTQGAMTGGTTVVDLDQELSVAQFLPAPSLIYTDIRTVTFHEVQGERVPLKSARAPLATSDRTRLYFYGDPATYTALDGRRLQLTRGATTAETIVATDPTAPAAGNALRALTLGPVPESFMLDDFPLDAPSVVVYGNIVDATQGHTEREAVLGNGDSRQAFQTFKLPKSPLTYHAHAGSTPPEQPELDIFVGERKWTLVPAFYGHGPKEDIYIVREDANGVSWVQFGDNTTGARLPSGIGNVRARARTGNGAWGPLREGTNVQAGQRLDRLDKIRLLGVATGGAQPEDADNARAAAPGKIQSLGRLVSLADFEAEALATAGVWRAAARWSMVSNVPAMTLVILTRTGGDAELASVRDIFAQYNRCRGPQRFPIVVSAGHLEYLFLDASIAIDPAYDQASVLARVKAALGVNGATGIDGSRGLLATGPRRFGEREYATRVAGAIQNVPGVLWAQVNGLGSLGPAADPATLVLPAGPWPLAAVIDCAADCILALDDRHIDLRTVAVPAKACE
jgi:hypothetical protein